MQFLNKLKSKDFSDLKDLQLNGTVPVKQEVINEILTERVVNEENPVTAASMEIMEGNEIHVHLAAEMFMIAKDFDIVLIIEKRDYSPESPQIICRIKDTSYKVIGKFLFMIKDLPAWLNIKDDKILIDLKTLAEQAGHGEYVRLVKKAEIRQESGRFFLDLNAGC